MSVNYGNAGMGDQSEYSDKELSVFIRDWMKEYEELEPLNEERRTMCVNIVISMLEETEQWYNPAVYLNDFDEEDVEAILKELNKEEAR